MSNPITITLETEEWNVVLNILGDQSFKTVAPLISKIQQQAQQSAANSHGNGSDTLIEQRPN